MENGLLLEKTLVAALQTVDGLSGRVCPIQDIQKSSGPLAVFGQQDESEENAIDGLTGMSTAVYEIHALHGTYQKMRLLAEQIKRTIQALRQYAEGALYIEEVTVALASRDIYEDRVQLFRRTYKVTIQYQIKEDM
ncbi:MAG: hypothetical protein J6K03_01240 [Oscillospiraceae bacterium]|nr:hypothetical protein [Oscillospiraceae bacterium]